MKIKEQDALQEALLVFSQSRMLASNTLKQQAYIAVPVSVEFSERSIHSLATAADSNALRICVIRDPLRFPHRSAVRSSKKGDHASGSSSACLLIGVARSKYMAMFGALDRMYAFHPAGNHGEKIAFMKSINAWKLNASSCRANHIYTWAQHLPTTKI